MDFKEGMRRLALLIGVLGSAFGCFASYLVLRGALELRARHKAFELLATSDVVQEARLSWLLAKLPPGYTPASSEANKSDSNTTHGPWEKYQQKDVATAWKSFSPERREELLGKMSPEQKSKLRAMIEQWKQQEEKDPYAESAEPVEEDPFAAIAKPISEVNKGRIKTIHWTQDLVVESIETMDGATLYPTAATTLWPYLLAILVPVFGFVIPWGSVRALAWVGAGFSGKPA